MADSTPATRRRALRDAVARQADEVRESERRRAAAERELHRLEAELKALDAPALDLSHERPAEGRAVPTTSAEKVALFRSLFRGREDIYSVMWTNHRKKKTGYALACGNEWVRDVCKKPRVRCGDCPNQEFLPVTDRVIRDHLRGIHVAGVHPLLIDETCWFLAADFDKGEWMKDVAAFRETCASAGLPVSIERSRSGDGAHAWFFFDAPVPAVTARRMGCYLITKAMSTRLDIEGTSYDRLFPNQDTMPRGGFGNLIALPLQHASRARGNSIFVDEEFHPFTDQWAYLASVRCIPASTVERVAADAVRRGQVLAVRPGGMEEDECAEPWLLPPSRRKPLQPPVVKEPLPARVQGRLAQRLFVAKAGLPPSAIHELKRLAAFANPEFYQKQRMRLSTALTPRLIACAEDLGEHVALPRGCTEEAVSLLRSLGSELEIEDLRNEGQAIEHRFRGKPTKLQEGAVHALLDHDIGMLVAPPGLGKTVAGIQLIARRGRNTLVLVHRRPLLDQWVAQLALFLGVEPGSIGRIGGGKRRVTRVIDVATIQSLVRKDIVVDLVADYGHVVMDECHHVAAKSFELVLAEVRARYVTGLTATPRRRDGHHPILEMQLGPARYVADPKSPDAARRFVRRVIVRETSFTLWDDGQRSIQDIYGALAGDDRRNHLILDDVIGSLEAGRSPLVLTERKAHLDYLAEKLRGFTKHLVVLKGGAGAKARSKVFAELNAIPDGEERLVLATGRYVGEGFDDARLDTLFLTMPVSWRGTVVQYTGRLHRSHPGKSEVRIYDYADRLVPALERMYKRRLAGYRSIGYDLAEDAVI